MKNVVLVLVTILLTCGAHGISYGQVCAVGDILSPGESCIDPGTGDTFSVLSDGRGRYLFITAGGGITLQGNISGVARNFIATNRGDGTWEIESVSPGGTTPPPPVQNPDLVIQQPTVSQSTLAPGENFTLSATVKNQGTGSAAETTLRYYRSTNTTIASSDTEVGTDSVSALGSNRSSAESITLTAPSSAGTYYYGACVDSVAGESQSNNNCSAAVSITVQRAPVVSTPLDLSIYWTDAGTEKIQRANLDGSNVQDLVTTGLTTPAGIALDVAGGKMYWTDLGTAKIQRANLDGSNVQDLVTRTQGLGLPGSVALDVAGGKMYWTDFGTEKIQRANLDGSNIQDLVTQRLSFPVSLALDVAGGKMYWTDYDADKIQCANLDGSNVQDLVTRELNQPGGLALDIAGGKMYWTDYDLEKIQRSNLDDSNVQDLVTSTQGLVGPYNIALDVASGKMYWTDGDAQKIQRANLDGSNVEDIITQGLTTPVAIALGIPSQTLPPTSSGQTPDLVLESVRADPSTVAPGENFTLSATVKNQGTGSAAATTLRYYRSTNTTISTSDTEVGTDSVSALGSNRSSAESITLTAPSSAGTYYYGACVDSVAGESQSNNNCSAAVSITVQRAPVVSTPLDLSIYWTDAGTDKIQRANLDGSNVQDLVTKGLTTPVGIALDVTGGKMYWTDLATDKIQRSNLDGSNVQDLITQGLGLLGSIALDVAGGKMYWTDFGTDKIQRANLDGSNIQDLVTQRLSFPVSLALDVAGGKMYWTDYDTKKIQRANLDGSNVQDLVTRGLNQPGGLALDIAGGKMYWTDYDLEKIQRSNLDDSNVQDLVTSTQGLVGPYNIALDVASGKMYWTDGDAQKIQRANLDGSNVEDIITRGLITPVAIALGISPEAPPQTVQEDVNRDGVVNVQDIVYVAQRYGQTGQNRADVNGDGVVNIDDIVLVAAVVDSTPAAPSIRSQLPKDLTAATVNQWVTEAKLRGNKTPTYQWGILTLESLLAVLTPEETALLANYPNPFNPETWIPYHLAKASEVQITIYDVSGNVVRSLDIGHQSEGYYTSQNRAAYWDGTNKMGETVASGTYFYSLNAGDFSATRKMLILK